MPVRRSARLALRAKKLIKKALKFPPELRDIILDQLWDLVRIRCHDPDTLRSCTLVNKDWYASARPHVFRAVRLDSWRRLVELAELAISDRRITRYIRKVYLYGESSANEGESVRDFVKADDSWILHFPLLLGGSLPCLQSIEICHFAYPFGNYEEQDREQIQRTESERFATWLYSLRTLKNVEELVLRDCMMSSNALTALVRSFRRLNRVVFREIILNTHGDLDAIPAHEVEGIPMPAEAHARNNGSYGSAELPVLFPLLYPRPKLQSVYLRYTFDEPFDISILKGWLLPGDVTATLKSLDVWGNFEVEPLTSFFSNFGPNPVLECLILVVDPEFHFDINLSPFLRLQRISFCPGFIHAESIGGLIRLLSRLTTSTHVVELTFSIELRHLDGLRRDDVGPLDDLLSSEKFQYLEVVTILHDFRHPLRQLRQASKEAFPRLSQRRILRFEVSE